MDENFGLTVSSFCQILILEEIVLIIDWYDRSLT